MIAFGHTAVGAAIGYYSFTYFGSGQPVEALLVAGTVGVISHYITDIIPHGHFFVTPKNNSLIKCESSRPGPNSSILRASI